MKTFKTLFNLVNLFCFPILLLAQNVGIGTNTPDSKLTVVDSVRSTINIKTLDNDKSTGIAFQNSGGSYAWNIFRKMNGNNTSDFIISGGDINSNIDNLTERFKITKDGNTEIYGTTTLDNTVFINGDLFTNGGGAVFNESGEDYDFRLESLDVDTLFFVDASQNRIGLNTNNPSARLDVVGTSEFNGNLTTINGSAIFNEDGHGKNFRIESETSSHMFFLSGLGNRIGINNPSPTSVLDVIGNTKITGDLRTYDGVSVFNENGVANDFRIESDTSQVMFFLDGSTNRIGINKGDPQEVLDVNGSTRINGKFTALGGNAVFNEEGEANSFRIETLNRNSMFFVNGSTDFIGIRTSDPSAELDINGELVVNGTSNLDGGIITSSISASGNAVFNQNGDAEVDFQIKSLSKDNMFFLDAENNKIGIGTNSPSAELHIVGSFQVNGESTFNEGGVDKDFRIEGKVIDTLFFVDASQNRIGLNTNNPSARLDVVGDTELNGDLVTEGGAIFNEGGINKDFRIESQNKEHMFFLDANNDNIGINNDSPSANLDVIGPTELNGELEINHGELANGDDWPITFSNVSASNFLGGLRLNNNGYVEMTNKANASGANKAQLDNTGTWTAVSDRRLKKNIITAEGLLSKSLQLEPVNYVFKSDENSVNQLGFIAQDVQKIFPEFVIDGDLLTLNYSGLSVVAIGAVKELNEKNVKLEARIAALEKANGQLAAQIMDLFDIKDLIKKEILAEIAMDTALSNTSASKE